MPKSNDKKPLQWPICIIDFEATSLSKQSYPIEVGVCLWTDPLFPARTWGSLIRPHETWLEGGDWAEEAFALHGISQDDLRTAPTTSQVASDLLHFCAQADLVFCDGGNADHHWHDRLCQAAGRSTGIVLASLQKLLFHHDIYYPYFKLAHASADAIRHRALPDAIAIMRRIAEASSTEIEISLPDHSAGPTQIALAEEASRL